MERLSLTRPQVERILAHARAEAPLEACGLLGGQDGCVLRVYPMENALQSTTRYAMRPVELFEALQAMEAQGWGTDPLGIYHSHPQGPETPSIADIAESYYPDSVYIILAYPLRREPSLRGFRIANGQVGEVELRILDGYS